MGSACSGTWVTNCGWESKEEKWLRADCPAVAEFRNCYGMWNLDGSSLDLMI